ncbi:MAG: hypothetical protein KDE56_15305 [Anaerolineales bacterium]|nr:hypothetical protein [Anaerolineales bacterium]
MGYKHVLLVEGKYDFHLIKNLLREHHISVVQPSKKLSVHMEDIVLQVEGNDDAVLRKLDLLLDDGDLETIGIILDTDSSLQGRWEAVLHRANSYGKSTLSLKPVKKGEIGIVERKGQRSVRLGVWLMPDNEHSGMLEDFASWLIPADDSLWLRARTCVSEIPAGEQRFAEVHRRKAELHTWLAWQKEPGRPMGLALTFRYLDANAPLARQFVQWVGTLFNLGKTEG